ncbi:hypothetical protein D3C87_2072160 [compost metagenome]
MTGRRTDVYPLGKVGVGQPSFGLQGTQDLEIDPVKIIIGRIFHYLSRLLKKIKT